MTRLRVLLGHLLCWPQALATPMVSVVDVLQGRAHPKSVEVLVELALDQRTSAIAQTDGIERKLIAMLTANGAYAALLVGLGTDITPLLVAAITLVGISVLACLFGLRPQRFPAAALSPLSRDLVAFDPVDTRRILLAESHRDGGGVALDQ